MTHDRIDRWFETWNAHDGSGLVPLFAPSGCMIDPSVVEPIPAAAVEPLVRSLVDLVPDLAFEVTSIVRDGHRAVARWVVRGTASGPWRPGIDPTGRPLELRGVDVFDGGPDGFDRVERYFDRTALVEQIGLMSLVQPFEQGPAKFGYSMRVASGNRNVPGIIALTWIRGRDDAERNRIRGHSRQIVRDFLEEPGFIGIVTGFTGDRGFTVTAWDDEAALHRALSKQHAKAMHELRSQDFVPGVWTSVWKPHRINRIWTRCSACAALEDVSDDHRVCHVCGAELPERPSLW